jgi:hypothetical protein
MLSYVVVARGRRRSPTASRAPARNPRVGQLKTRLANALADGLARTPLMRTLFGLSSTRRSRRRLRAFRLSPSYRPRRRRRLEPVPTRRRARAFARSTIDRREGYTRDIVGVFFFFFFFFFDECIVVVVVVVVECRFVSDVILEKFPTEIALHPSPPRARRRESRVPSSRKSRLVARARDRSENRARSSVTRRA